MSRSATPATRNEATPHVKPSKVTPFAKLTIGTAIRGLRGCERWGDVERTHPPPPDPQSETGTLATHSGKIHEEWDIQDLHQPFYRYSTINGYGCV